MPYEIGLLANVKFHVAKENNTSVWAPVNYPRPIPCSLVPLSKRIIREMAEQVYESESEGPERNRHVPCTL